MAFACVCDSVRPRAGCACGCARKSRGQSRHVVVEKIEAFVQFQQAPCASDSFSPPVARQHRCRPECPYLILVGDWVLPVTRRAAPCSRRPHGPGSLRGFLYTWFRREPSRHERLRSCQTIGCASFRRRGPVIPRGSRSRLRGTRFRGRDKRAKTARRK
jgi:hypothetical protein